MTINCVQLMSLLLVVTLLILCRLCRLLVKRGNFLRCKFYLLKLAVYIALESVWSTFALT